MTEITYDQTLAALKEIVEGREDYVYKKPETAKECFGAICVYADRHEGPSDSTCAPRPAADANPSCLVGHVFHHFGLLHEVTRDEGTAERVIRRDRLPFTDDAAHLLGKVQMEQDSGEPWGNALRRALP